MDEHKEDMQDKELRQRYENAMDYTVRLLEEMVGDESLIRSLYSDRDEEAERKLRDRINEFNKRIEKWTKQWTITKHLW